ncbi:Protein kinase-like domain [Penicillium digitatum]|uniref:Aminoglycoside phosphotransferase domain-containing protein n=2 Tax=Penicillium digitatum TaxID=36651 RepID=K9F5H9_PEND1|nr:hypothetical protein PDIP_87820 [Penicillium digitatum Pd1]EKV04274.1 hypothetical protein PDIP_87820 [Penicillium digitatum Pd1]QQK39814.1 Protein kinase-like domain [Penicillium digitatum]
MADHSSPDYKDLYLKAKEREKQAKECEKQADEREKQADERTRKTTLTELIQHCHVLLSRWMKVGSPSNSTTGKIPLPKGKYCPTRLEHWTDCPKQLSEVYKSVYQYLHPERGQELRLFSSMAELEWFGRHFASDPLSSERQLETYERFGVQFQVHKIISELCKLPAAREEFGLGDGIHFGNHKNSLSENEPMEDEANELPSIRQPRADQFCINRIDGTSTTILATVEYKPPDKLPSATFRMGLRPMDLWKDVVQSNKIPTDQEEKLKYSATRLVCSAIVQEYHLMIQEGLEYSYLTNGLTRVLLRVPRDQPSTLYYFFCDPDSEITPEGRLTSQLWKSSVARVLCLCLLAFRSPIRGQEWRNRVHLDLHTWHTSFDHTHSQIPGKELQQLHHSGSTNPESSSPDSGSSFVLPSSSPPPSPSEGRRVPTRSQTSCAPSEIRSRSQSPSSSGSDTNQAASHKRRISQVTSSPSAQQSGRQQKAGHDQDDHSQRRAAQFCTQRCLLGLQTRNALDALCPNVDRHCLGQTDPTQHPISVEELILSLKTQLDEDIDRCIPLGGCGSYGAPFKLTCMKHGYTVLGKGTTSGLWKEVSREAQVYRVLRRAQGSAVPIFLGTIDLAKIYFLHGAGQIRHMLIMGWGGECTAKMELTQRLRREIHKSNKEIKALGIIHEDPSQDNVLWCEELGRALIIDFHRSTLRCRPAKQRSGDAKRRLRRVQEGDGKRLRAS